MVLGTDTEVAACDDADNAGKEEGEEEDDGDDDKKYGVNVKPGDADDNDGGDMDNRHDQDVYDVYVLLFMTPRASPRSPRTEMRQRQGRFHLLSQAILPMTCPMWVLCASPAEVSGRT